MSEPHQHKCIECWAPANTILCDKCASANLRAARILEVLFEDRVIPYPLTHWRWDLLTARALWRLAKKLASVK